MLLETWQLREAYVHVSSDLDIRFETPFARLHRHERIVSESRARSNAALSQKRLYLTVVWESYIESRRVDDSMKRETRKTVQRTDGNATRIRIEIALRRQGSHGPSHHIHRK